MESSLQRATGGQRRGQHEASRPPSAQDSPLVAHPPSVLYELLHLAREHGVAFDQAWHDAIPHATQAAGARSERFRWSEAFESTRDAWHAAYARQEPTALEAAVAIVACDREVPTVERRYCGYCQKALPPDADPKRRYCDLVCQRAMHGRKAPAPIAA
jgi:hypothetical protein